MCWDVIPKQKLVSAQDLIGDPTIHSIEVCGKRQSNYV